MITKTDQDIIYGFLEDNSGLTGGYAQSVVFPENEEGIRDFLKEASKNKIPVTVAGGGTGVCGGRIPFGGVVLATEKMNKILKIGRDSQSNKGYAVAQPGITVGEFKKAMEAEGFMYPYDPTEQTAFIGGTVATNASGARSFKYGPTRDSVRALRVVLSDGGLIPIRRGEIFADENREFDILSSNGRRIHFPIPTYRMPKIKNSAGYFAHEKMDLIDLFIGQEGTLGAITEIELRLEEMPDKILSCFAFFDRVEKSWDFAHEARVISLKTRKTKADRKLDAMALEYFDQYSLVLLRDKYPHIPQNAQACIFFEQEMKKETEDEIIDGWQKLLERYGVGLENTWVALTSREREILKEFRHDLPSTINETAKRNKQPKVAIDTAVKDDKFKELMQFYLKILDAASIQYILFAHIGDSRFHLNLLPLTKEELTKSNAVCLKMVKETIRLGGTPSCEHGIGKTKHANLEALYGMSGLAEMAGVKKALDPSCILGLDNIFPKELLKNSSE